MLGDSLEHQQQDSLGIELTSDWRRRCDIGLMLWNKIWSLHRTAVHESFECLLNVHACCVSKALHRRLGAELKVGGCIGGWGHGRSGLHRRLGASRKSFRGPWGSVALWYEPMSNRMDPFGNEFHRFSKKTSWPWSCIKSWPLDLDQALDQVLAMHPINETILPKHHWGWLAHLINFEDGSPTS